MEVPVSMACSPSSADFQINTTLADLLTQELRARLDATCRLNTDSQLCERYASFHPISIKWTSNEADGGFICEMAYKADPLTGLPYPNHDLDLVFGGDSGTWVVVNSYGAPVFPEVKSTNENPQWLCPQGGAFSECFPLILDPEARKVSIAFSPDGSVMVRNFSAEGGPSTASRRYRAPHPAAPASELPTDTTDQNPGPSLATQ